MDDPKSTLSNDLQSLRIDKKKSSGKSRRRTGRWIAGGVIAVLILLSAWYFLNPHSPYQAPPPGAIPTPEPAPAVSPFQGAPVLSAGGYVIARHQVEVASKIAGRVVSITVDEGDTIGRGEIIATLDDAELRAQLRQAEANLASARAALAELEAGTRPQEILRAQALVESARADKLNADINLERAESLVSAGVSEKQALDDARARADMAAAALQAAQENYDLAKAGPRSEEIERARAEVLQAEAAVAYARALLDNTVIRAPITGTILNRFVDPGEMVTTGFTSERGARQALVNMANLKDLQVELDIAEADIAKVEHGQPVIIRPDAYIDREYHGRVEFISSVGDRQKATIKVKVNILDPDDLLRPDMGAKVSFYPRKGEAPPAR
jgi:HlyD family secretion protein